MINELAKAFIMFVAVLMAAAGGIKIEEEEAGGGLFLLILAYILGIVAIFVMG